MSVSAWAPLLSIIGALFVAALIGWIRKPRLVVFVPRLFSYSGLSGKGQLAEISVLNRGFKTEEAIELSLRTTFQYEIVGANSNDVSLKDHKLLIPRIGAGDDVTTLLHVEGGTFTGDEIANCLSKESKGRFVSRLDAVPMTGPQRIGLVAVCIAFPALMYAVSLGIDSYFKRERESVSKVTEKLEAATKGTQANVSETSRLIEQLLGDPKGKNESIAGWTVAPVYLRVGGPLVDAVRSGAVKVTIGSLQRKKEIVTVPITMKNDSAMVMRVTVSATSQQSEGKIPSYERRFDVLVTPGASVAKSINVIVPSKSATGSDKAIYVDAFLDENGGDSLKMRRTVVAD